MPRSSFLVLLVGVSLALPVSLTATITRNVDRTFAVEPGGTFKASTEGGDIVIRTADIAEVRVTARQRIKASSDQSADEILEKLVLTMRQEANDVTVESKYGSRGFGFRFGSWPPVQVDFIVTLPTRFAVDLSTSGGDIQVGSLAGAVRVHTSGGDIKLERIDGDINARTSGGDITLREGTARAKIHTSGGDILIERAGGPVEAGTSGGDIIIRSVAQSVQAHTSGGDIRAVLAGPLDSDSSLGTSGGDVSVRLDPAAAFTLDASTSGGRVDANGITITIDKGGLRKSTLKGRVNGGGPYLKLRSSGGDIDIRTD